MYIKSKACYIEDSDLNSEVTLLVVQIVYVTYLALSIDINLEGSPTREVTLHFKPDDVPRTAAPSPGVVENLYVTKTSLCSGMPQQ